MPAEPDAWPLKRVLEALAEHKVRFILVGGQAVVAYGASQFTRDADFWVQPTQANLSRLRRALDDIQAVPRFLPPLELDFLKRGHGVHFKFRHQGRDFTLDFLGNPPRLPKGAFFHAWKESLQLEWEGVPVRILDLPRLVQTKKTERERDYEVISNLVDLVFQDVKDKKRIPPHILEFLVRETRNPESLRRICRTGEKARKLAEGMGRKPAILASGNASLEEIQASLEEEKMQLKRANLEYWRPFLAELRALKKKRRNLQ